MEIIRHIATTTLLACALTGAQAQQTFTARVTERHMGDGVVVLHQDDEITRLIDKLDKRDDARSTNSTPSRTQTGTGNISSPAADEATVETTEIDLGDGRKVYRNSIKMQGFRIQVYSGGNSRQAKQAAESMARRTKQHFPDQPVYTHFYSPRWICRMGDFRTIEEATEMLRQMKETGDFRQAVIVKSIVQIAL